MRSISLYVDKDTYLTRMHPFTKLCYILTAIAASLIAGKLWAFAIFIGISLVMLISGKIIRKVFPLIAFSFTILITIFLIHGLFNHENANLMFQLGPLKFYREGMMYALRISCNVLNMLLAFAVFVLTTKPAECGEQHSPQNQQHCGADEADRAGRGSGAGRILAEDRICHQFCFSDHTADERHDEHDHGCTAEPWA